MSHRMDSTNQFSLLLKLILASHFIFFVLLRPSQPFSSAIYVSLVNNGMALIHHWKVSQILIMFPMEWGMGNRESHVCICKFQHQIFCTLSLQHDDHSLVLFTVHSVHTLEYQIQFFNDFRRASTHEPMRVESVWELMWTVIENVLQRQCNSSAWNVITKQIFEQSYSHSKCTHEFRRNVRKIQH